MIPFVDLKPQYSKYESELAVSVVRVMRSGIYLMGPELDAFEKEFAEYLEVKYAVGVGSGTDALTLAIRGLRLTSRDEVIVPANAYPTAFGVAAAGVKLRLCDVDEDTLNISAKTLAAVLTRRTKAVVVVHLYGMPARMEEIMEMAKMRNLLIIEDCAQAAGAKINGRNVGTFGNIGCFSFYPTKNLGAMGDGGAVVTNNRRLAERVKRLRMYGEDVRYHCVEFSTHSRLDEIQAAILRVKLRHLDEELSARQKIAGYYRRELPEEILIPKVIPDNVEHASHLFVVRVKGREKIQGYLGNKGVETAIHYPAPIHFQPAFSDLGYKKGDFPVAESASRQVLSLPFYAGLKKTDQRRVLKINYGGC